MRKGEISWTKRNDEGEKFQVYAHLFGREWTFFIREKRYDQWQQMEQPALEDWMALLDGVRRRAARRLMPPDQIERVRRLIREQFPEAKV